MLGVFHRSTASRRVRCQLEPGDRIVLFTDGVTEAGNVDGEEFGEARLVELVSRIVLPEQRKFSSES